jgi:hypothetical protein
MPAYLEFHNRIWGCELIGTKEKVIQAFENYDDKPAPMPAEVKDFLLSVLRSVREVEPFNALDLKVRGYWLEPKDGGSPAFPLELSIELRRTRLCL